MSDATGAVLLICIYLASVAGLAWVIAAISGFHFGPILLLVIIAYLAILALYACYGRTYGQIVRKRRTAWGIERPQAMR
jgi:hypothetical protein